MHQNLAGYRILGPVHTYGLDRSPIDLAFIRAECERSQFFEIDLGSIQPGSLQEVVWDRSQIDLHYSVLSENANTSWKRSSLVAFPHGVSRKPISREAFCFRNLQDVCKKRRTMDRGGNSSSHRCLGWTPNSRQNRQKSPERWCLHGNCQSCSETKFPWTRLEAVPHKGKTS